MARRRRGHASAGSSRFVDVSERDGGGGSDHVLALVHERTRAVIASSVALAFTRRARRVGLLGRTHLDAANALFLAPCLTIHTAFMQFPIDVVFLARDRRAVRLIHELRPWRAAVSVWAHAVIELAAGSLRRHDVRIGDRLYLTPDWTLAGRGGHGVDMRISQAMGSPGC